MLSLLCTFISKLELQPLFGCSGILLFHNFQLYRDNCMCENYLLTLKEMYGGQKQERVVQHAIPKIILSYVPLTSYRQGTGHQLLILHCNEHLAFFIHICGKTLCQILSQGKYTSGIDYNSINYVIIVSATLT